MPRVNAMLKQHILVRTIEKICIVSFIAIVALMPIHAFISTWGGTQIGPLLVWKSWKEILLLALVPLAVAYFFARPELFKIIWSRLFNKLIALYVVLHLLLTIVAQASNQAVIAGLLINLRFFAIFILAQALVVSGHPWVEKIKKTLPTWLLWIAIGLSALAILQVTIIPKDFLAQFGYNKDTTIAPFLLLDDNQDALRAFATMRGPNTLGAYLLIPLAFALYFVAKRQQLALASTALSLGFIALILTGSRSAWIGFAAMLVALALAMLPRPTVKKWLKIGTIPAIIVGTLLLWASINIPVLRLAIFHSSPGDPHLLEGSTENHWVATAQGITAVIANPLGTGPGTAGPASFYDNEGQVVLSENYYVQIGQEIGIIGMALFLIINILVAANLFRQKATMPHLLFASFIGLSIINIFLHGWADDPTALTWWGIAGLFIADLASSRHNKKQQ